LNLPSNFERFNAGQRKPEFLAWASICLASGARSYVELGTGHAAYMREMGIEKVVAVDINTPLYGIEDAGVHYVGGSSYDISTLAKVTEILGGMPDIVFIDADHDGDAPLWDFNLWHPVAQKLVGFHDIQIPNIKNRIWPAIALAHPSVEILGRDFSSAAAWQGPLCPADGILSGGGIGVIWK
jgi:hypothetical protein